MVGEAASHLPVGDRRKPQMLLYLASQEEIDIQTRYIPERGLLLAVLERAVRDLGRHVTTVERRAALEWFKGEETDLQDAISYQFVKKELGLNISQVHLINKYIAEGEELQRLAIDAKRKTLNIKLENVSVLSRN